MDSEVKHNVRGQAKHGLRVSNVKIRKYLQGLLGQISWKFWLTVCFFCGEIG